VAHPDRRLAGSGVALALARLLLGDAALELADLARTVDAELTGAGWALDPKEFRAHLTLARSDGVPAGAAIGARLADAAATLDLRFRAERIGLFESLTGGGPARYEPLEIAALR